MILVAELRSIGNEFLLSVTFSGVQAVDGWPKTESDDNITLGQVTGVAVDSSDHVHIFHRGARAWEHT